MQDASSWAPDLGAHRLLADGRTAALVRRDGTVDWWCAPGFDDAPLCWQLLDREGGLAAFPGTDLVRAAPAPAGSTTWTVLRTPGGDHVQVRDGLLPVEGGVALVRLLRRATPGPAVVVEHLLRLGGADGPAVALEVVRDRARGTHTTRGGAHEVVVVASAHRTADDGLRSSVQVPAEGAAALVVGVGGLPPLDPEELDRLLDGRGRDDTAALSAVRPPRRHPQRALDALAVIRACTFAATGAVVAAPTFGLPEAPGSDRQFDYRYTWLRDASLSTAVAALLGRTSDADRYLGFVHRAWGDADLLERPLRDVRGGDVPVERELDGVAGWAGSLPVRVGNDAAGQRQYDSLGLLVEAVSVHVQVGGRLERRTWDLVRRLADEVTAGVDGPPPLSNGIWELRYAAPLLDADIGRWLVLDRATWIARGWRPWTRRRAWVAARDRLAERIVGALDDDGMLPQQYGPGPGRPDASALMAVAFGLLDRDDPRAHRLVDVVLERLASGPYVYRYPTGTSDGFSGREGAFLPVSFLAVTALASLGRVEQARARLDALCAALPRLLSEEVDPLTDRLLGNAPLVWSHAELARALYVLDASERRDRWGTAGLWAWRLQRYLSLRAATRGARPPEEEPDGAA